MLGEHSENSQSNIAMGNESGYGISKAPSTPKISKSQKNTFTPTSSSRPLSSRSASKGILTPRANTSPGPASSTKDAAKLAKLLSTAERIKKVSLLKEKWAKEREEKMQLNKEKKARELQKLQEEHEAAAEARKLELNNEKTYESLEKKRERELLAASLEERALQAKLLEQQAKAKRRISVFLNRKLRDAAMKKEADLKAEKQRQLYAELADRRTDFLETRQAKLREEMNRRESLANRGVAARQQKKIEEELARKMAEEEFSLLATRKENWEDDHNTKKQEEQNRRESIAGRLDHWREQKKIESKLKEHTKQQEHELFTTRALEHQDVQRYKKELAERDRRSLAGRLQKWREQREDPGIKKLAESIERELQDQAYQDMKNYKAKLEQDRRASLKYRLEKAFADKKFDAGQVALKKMVQEEERKLKEADRAELLKYQQKIREDRRASMQMRNQQENEARKLSEEKRIAELEAAHEDFKLREEDWKALKEYQEALREKERKSIAGRLAQAYSQKEIDLERHREMMDQMHRDFELKRLDNLEMSQYRDEERVRSRRSIALRLASWKESSIQEEQERAKMEMQLLEEAALREEDLECIQAAKAALGLE